MEAPDYFDTLPNEMLLKIFKNMDGETLENASLSYPRLLPIVQVVVQDHYRRYRDRHGRAPPNDWPFDQVVAASEPVKSTSVLNDFVNSGQTIFGVESTSLPENINDLSPIFIGHGMLRIVVDLVDITDPGYPDRSPIYFVINMSDHDGVLTLVDFARYLYGNIDSKFLTPLSHPDHNITNYLEERLISTGEALYINAIRKEANGSYFVDLVD